ncbi:MAG: hypothetical protein HYV09_10215 [Deltaproteobacteria bacterium]|nr:hypothetical protein [Deltaproteobacteria bacterium]
MKRYMVDARRSVSFDALEEAKIFAQNNFPAVILERRVGPDGRPIWVEVLRFDWHWNAERGEPAIEFW